MAKAKEPKRGPPKPVDLQGWDLHNGEGRPDLQFRDPLTNEVIGGQRGAMRQCMRVRFCVMPWARRTGKSTMRQGLIINEAAVTPGMYYFGLVLPDHATAFKIFESFRKALGAFVKDSKGDDKSQDRWIELHEILPPADEPEPWLTPHLAARWRECRGKNHNTGSKLYFWSGKHPHYEGIQGFLHPFHRVDVDEAQQVHPMAYSIVLPMLNDVRGHMCITGTPWSMGIGNVAFEEFWNTANDPAVPDWFGMSVADGANPFVKATPLVEARRTLSDKAIRQLLNAEFISDAGAVFTNLDRVFVLKPLPATDLRCAWARDLRAKFSLPTMQWWVHQHAPVAGHVYAVSVDWARSPRGDYSVLVVMDLSTGEQAALLRWRGEDFTAQMEVVLAVQSHYRATQLHSDDNGIGRPMQDFLRRRHALGFVGHKFSQGNKVDYVRRLQILFADATISLIACDEQRKEFKDFSAFEAEGLGSEKVVKYCAPEGRFDDMVAALLQLSPTLTISGRQTEQAEEAPPVPVFEKDAKTTTLERFFEGQPTPWAAQDEEPDDGKFSLDSVIVPRRLG
jgi:hypothetical protein